MTAPGAASRLGARKDIPALRHAIAALLALMVAVNILFFVGLMVTDSDDPFVNVGLALACQWIPVTIFWLVARRAGAFRLPVVLAAAAVTFSAIGDTYYSLAVDADGFLALPSPADPAYLLFYPLMVAALLALTHRRLAGAGRLVVLESAVVTVGASALLAVALGPAIDAALASGTALEIAVSFAYPLFDLLLIGVIAGIASAPTVRIGRRWWALIVGLAVFAAGDVAYALLAVEDAYVVGTPLDVTWTVGLAFMTWWVAGVAGVAGVGRERSSAIRKRFALSLPAVAVLAGLAVLVIGTVTHVSRLAIVLAALTVALGAVPIIFRQAMLGRMLADQDEAVRRLTELDKAKTDLLVTVNHEFRTPLTSINGHVELLLDGSGGEIPPAAMDMLHTIERNGAKLQRLIDETFTASSFEDGRDRMDRAPLVAVDLVARAVTPIEPIASSGGVHLRVEGEDPTLVVQADGAQLERALANLVDNAVKFTGPGGEVTVTVDSASDGDVLIRVEDTGIGIPPDDIPRVFGRFFRASNVQGAAIPGVGLGLSIARQIVHAHGGSLAVESALDRGTTMTVRLPAVAGR